MRSMEFDLPMVTPAPLPDVKGRPLGRLQGPLREYRRLPHGGDGIIRAVYGALVSMGPSI